MATKKFKCKVCGYIHEGDAAPEKCPVCQAPASEFELVEKVKKGGLDKNGNLYIILYATVMVVVVAALLAVTALSLQPRQNANVLNEKKNAILQSLGEVDANGNVTKDYDEFIEAYAVDAEGRKIENVDVFGQMSNLKESFKNGIYPVFEAADGRYVIPVTGQGLWDAIWGYVALEADMNTVSGVVFDHKSETPGLGAEIATPKHQSQYKGKKIFEGKDFVSVKLIKGGAAKDAVHEVDAITGGTKTSDGVSAMLYDCLKNYVPFFESVAAASAADAEESEVSNEQNVENNE